MAPVTCVLFRQKLAETEISPENIQDFVDRNGSIPRYNGAFKLVWGFLKASGIDPVSATLNQIASAIISLHKHSTAQARNGYAAMLLIPGYSQLRFLSVLQPYKKLWNSNTEKYASFWDPTELLKLLARTPLHWDNVLEVRELPGVRDKSGSAQSPGEIL